MEQESNNKKRLIVLATILVVLLFVVGYFIFTRDEEAATTLQGAGGVEASILGADALQTISQIESLRLSNNLFNNPNFIGFVDTTVDVDTEAVGRSNPFLPIR